MKEVMIVVGAGQISMAIARRIGAGKKIILGDGRANHELFEESDQVYFVPMGDAQALADCIMQIADKSYEVKED